MDILPNTKADYSTFLFPAVEDFKLFRGSIEYKDVSFSAFSSIEIWVSLDLFSMILDGDCFLYQRRKEISRDYYKQEMFQKLPYFCTTPFQQIRCSQPVVLYINDQ